MNRLTAILAMAILAFTGCTTAQTGKEMKAEGPAFETYKNIVEFDTVKEQAVIPRKDNVLIIDARPKRKFAKGHIPVAINISNSQFDKQRDQLPKNKDQLIIYYCGGVKCPLSHKSARAAEALGYTNVQVYSAGYPDWVKNGGYPGVTAAYVKKAVSNGATVVDARPPRKYKKGHVDGAINISVTRFDKQKALLPSAKDAELIFYCGGYKCPLSQKVADKVKALGYTNIKLFQAGYPGWKAMADQ
ncbi:rhodanese-like domain-containing protein [Magnetococcales bacterium HHB-1]